MAKFLSVCPLNCPDSCSFHVESLNGNLKIHGNIKAMGVGGFICPKGRALGDLVYSPDRLRYPMYKVNGNWRKINWDEAYTIITSKITDAINKSGSQSILHMYDNGHNGHLRKLDRRFFQALGGVTEPRGSMCWGAGIKALEEDFGTVYSSDWEQLLYAKTIVLWGRDPAITNKHLIPLLRQAGDSGIHIIVINPLKVKSTAFANEYIRVNPGTDGALALGIAHIILRERWMDFNFIKEYASNFGAYAALVKEYPPEKTAQICGVPIEVIERFAKRLTHEKSAMFFLGYGLQRYINGGNTIRAIDALAAISGNIGCQGAGVIYGHQYHKANLNSLLLPEHSYQSRTFPHATIVNDLLDKNLIPQIEVAFFTRTNTMVTEPDSIKWRDLCRKIPFKVTLDVWMSQTASVSDLILPITTIFEEEEIIATSWSNMIQYAHKGLEPQAETKPEPVIFTELAQRLGIGEYFPYNAKQWIEYIIEPIKKFGITLEQLKQGPCRAPYIPSIAYEEKKFNTLSGKIELVTLNEYMSSPESPVEKYFEEKALKEFALTQLAQDAEFKKQLLSTDAGEEEDKAQILFLEDYRNWKKNNKDQSDYPYILMTPHPDNGMHTQFQQEEGFEAFIHPSTALYHKLRNGDRVAVETETGQLIATVYLTDAIHELVVMIPEGTTDNHIGVNSLITGKLSSIGENTAYYDTFCNIRKWESD